MAKQWLMSNYNNDGNKLDCTYVAIGKVKKVEVPAKGKETKDGNTE